jgi:hypothetical protein
MPVNSPRADLKEDVKEFTSLNPLEDPGLQIQLQKQLNEI